MKYLSFLFLGCSFVFLACQKETDLQLPLKENIIEQIEYSKSDLKIIFNSSKVAKNRQEVIHPCNARITISNLQETNAQNGHWKVRIHSNSWWPEVYYEFTEEGDYDITLPRNTSLSIAFSTTLYDWTCVELPSVIDERFAKCDYSARADITFSADFEQFSETFEAYVSPNYSNGMSYQIHTDDCGIADH